MGYFGMLDAADIFVFYDDVQFSAQSWQQRNRIRNSQGSMWLTVPIVRQYGSRICDTRINNSTNWKKKHWESIKQGYSKAPFFTKYASIFQEIYNTEWEYLADLNICLIKKIADVMGLKTKFIISSEIKVEGVKTERLINILKKIGATEYISGPGAKDYIEVDRFKESGIRLYWYEFEHPAYPQRGDEFVPYLSLIDLLLNTGGGAVTYVREGSQNALVLDKGCLK